MCLKSAQNTSYETRRDGWPLCPRCGEDELWSAITWDGLTERPPMEIWLAAGLTCYKCRWSNIDPITWAVGPIADGYCLTCLRIHGRDTSAPIQCEVCHKVVGCFWHDRNSEHIRACWRARAGLADVPA